MKKMIALLLALAMMTMAIASCGNGAEDTTTVATTTAATTTEATSTESTTTEATQNTETTTETTTQEQTTETTTEETTTEATTVPVVEIDPIEAYKDNLVLHLDFDAWDSATGIVKDMTGNGHDATAVGGVSTAESYDGSSAAHFTQNGNHFVVKNDDALNFKSTDSFTISFWYCYDENTSFSRWPCVINKGLTSDSTDCYAVMLGNSGKNKGINFTVSSTPVRGGINLNASQDVTLNQWHHFVAVQDADQGTVVTYVDGIRGDFITAPSDVTTATDLFIGAMNEKQRQYLGKLDDLMIYNCALEASVIQDYKVEEEKLLLDLDFADQPDGVLGEGAILTYDDAEPNGFYASEGFTLSIRFKRGEGSAAGTIIQKVAGNASYGFSLDEQNRLIMNVGNLKYYADAAIDTEWHHAVMIQNPESMTLLFYLDGVIQGSTKPYNQTVTSISHDLNGNGAIQVNSANVKCSIDDVKLYNYAVNEAVILNGYKTVDAMGREIYNFEDSVTGETMDLPYRVYYPSDYDAASDKTYPILFFLHGHGETGIDNTQNLRVNGGENKLINDLIAKDSVIIVAPQALCDDGGNREWFDSSAHTWNQGSRAALPETPTLSMRAAMALLDSYLASGKVDTKRVYAGGISMGGYGTWELITRKSDVFAAAVPLCGAGIPTEASKLVNIAIWAFHGTADTTVPPSGTSDMEAAIKAAGGTKITATYLSGVGHSCWDAAYATSTLVDWLLSQSK